MSVEHKFSKRKYYMFGFNYNGGEPSAIIVDKPQEILNNFILFAVQVKLKDKLKSLSEYVHVKDVVAVGDNKNGTVRVSGWSGKYTILNQEIFDSLVESGVIKIID